MCNFFSWQTTSSDGRGCFLRDSTTQSRIIKIQKKCTVFFKRKLLYIFVSNINKYLIHRYTDYLINQIFEKPFFLKLLRVFLFFFLHSRIKYHSKLLKVFSYVHMFIYHCNKHRVILIAFCKKEPEAMQ